MQVCTVLTRSQLAHARVLAESLRRHHPRMSLTAVVVDDPAGLVANEPFELIPLAELSIDDAERTATEGSAALQCSVRPHLVRRLLRNGRGVAYLDPETRILRAVDWHATGIASLGPDEEPTLVLAPASARDAVDDWCRTGTPPIGAAPPGFMRLADSNGAPQRGNQPAVVDFSGIDVSRPPQDDPWAAALVSEYARDLDRAGHGDVSRLAYGHGPLADDGPLGLILRRLASARGEGQHPLATEAGVTELLEWAAEPAVAEAPVNRFVHTWWQERPDLQAAFPDPLGADGAGLVEWALGEGRSQIDMPEAVRPSGVASPATRPNVSAPDVNLVGRLSSEMGLGEAARRAIEALDSVDVRVFPVDSAVVAGRRGEIGFSSFDAADAAFDVNLLCINGDELLDFAALVGEGFFADRHTIGMWFWELAEPPAEWSAALELLDELWAASRSMAEGLSATVSIPVRHMPLPIRVPPAGPFDRAAWGIPEEDFLFLFAFDFNSTIARKNPLGLIEAFTSAFAPGEGASLLLKTMNAASQIRDAERLALEASRHEHVHLVDRTVSAREMTAITTGADCYVSLHRAEGFGLTIADAMYLGKPVIATAYGGSLDFANEDNSYPVGYELTRVGPGAAPYPPNGTWAEPDLEQAGRAMRHVFEHPNEATERGERGRRDVRRTHSAEAVGRQMRARLSQLPGRRPEATVERAEPAPPAEYVPRIPPEPSAASARAGALVPALRAGPRLPEGGLRGLVKRGVLRVIRPYSGWQVEQNRRMADAVAALAEAHDALDRRLGSLEAELDRLGAVLVRAEHRLDLEAHHRETSGERLASTYGRAQWELRADVLALRRRHERAIQELGEGAAR